MALSEWRFNCSECKHEQQTLKLFKACPMCKAGGFSLWHTGPVVESDGLPVPKSRKVTFT